MKGFKLDLMTALMLAVGLGVVLTMAVQAQGPSEKQLLNGVAVSSALQAGSAETRPSR